MVEEVDGVIKAWAAAYTDQVQAFVGIVTFFNRYLRFMGDETDGRIYVMFNLFGEKLKPSFSLEAFLVFVYFSYIKIIVV